MVQTGCMRRLTYEARGRLRWTDADDARLTSEVSAVVPAYMTGASFSTGRPDVLPSIPDVLRHVAGGAFDPSVVFSDHVPWDDAPQALTEGLRKPVLSRQRSTLAP